MFQVNRVSEAYPMYVDSAAPLGTLKILVYLNHPRRDSADCEKYSVKAFYGKECVQVIFEGIGSGRFDGMRWNKPAKDGWVYLSRRHRVPGVYAKTDRPMSRELHALIKSVIREKMPAEPLMDYLCETDEVPSVFRGIMQTICEAHANALVGV